MSKWWYVGGVSCLLVLSPGCDEPAVAGDRCIVELAEASVAESTIVDVEQLVPRLVDRLGAEPYWSDVPSITTACRAPGMLPDQERFLPGREAATEYVKAVGIMRTGGVTGMLFAYESRGVEETQTGIAIALVEYRPDGAPERMYKASELLEGETLARLTKSTVTADSIERCTQEIDYAFYAENGDIVGEREVPDRSPPDCETIVQFADRLLSAETAGQVEHRRAHTDRAEDPGAIAEGRLCWLVDLPAPKVRDVPRRAAWDRYHRPHLQR